MPLKSTPERYGTVAIALHWGTAVLIVALLFLGLSAANADDDAARRALLGPHMGLGITVMVLTVARIIWWWLLDRRPHPVPGLPTVMRRAAGLSHFLIYGLIIALVVTGMGTSILGGVSDALMTGAPIPELDDVPPRQGHGVLAWTFMVLLVVHVGAALYHHLIRRDKTLARMVGRAG